MHALLQRSGAATPHIIITSAGLYGWPYCFSEFKSPLHPTYGLIPSWPASYKSGPGGGAMIYYPNEQPTPPFLGSPLRTALFTRSVHRNLISENALPDYVARHLAVPAIKAAPILSFPPRHCLPPVRIQSTFVRASKVLLVRVLAK